MTQQSITVERPAARSARPVLTGLLWIVSVALLLGLLVQVAYQLLSPLPAHRLLIVKDIPLPGAFGGPQAEQNPLAPGVSVVSEHFDFQALDPVTHQLFIAHYGVNPDKLSLMPSVLLPRGATKDPRWDGNIVVFDTLRNQVAARIDVPHIAGIAVASDLHKVYAANADDNIVYAIDERTLKPTPIQLDDNESPDAVSYDPTDHRVFVSDPGTVPNTSNPQNIDAKNENVTVIDARTDTVVAKINIGKLPLLAGENPRTTSRDGRDVPAFGADRVPLFGYSVGHNVYDEALHRVFVTTQILPDATLDTPIVPLRAGEIMAIDPVAAKVVRRVLLPPTCASPHGMAIDTQQQLAFIACTEVDADRSLKANLVRVDLHSMSVIRAEPKDMLLAPGPDIVALDRTQHVLFVACKGGVSVFDERPGAFRKLGDYRLGKGTHTIAIDEATQYIYFPIYAGGRPIMRIAQYYASGA